jgi:hypothetical protein
MSCDTLFYGLQLNKPRNEEEFTVDTSLYDYNYNCQNIVLGWLSDGTSWERLVDGDSNDIIFKAFISYWIAFNAWAACVTDHDTDWKWKLSLMKDARNSDKFKRLLEGDAAFREKARSFSFYWPIFKAQELRKNRVPSQEGNRDREAVVAAYHAHGVASFEPQCFFLHWEAGVDAREAHLDWPHTLAALYRVRCNLFHGEKKVASDNDREIVLSALRVLHHFMKHGLEL